MISPLFTTIVAVAGIIFVFMKFTSSRPEDGIKSFRERERRADNTLKKPLDDLDFIRVPIDDIPAPEPAVNAKCASLVTQLKALSEKKAVNLTGISNTDLKLTYGAPNLPILTEYDQAFTAICTTLYELGIEYKNAGFEDEAVTVLNTAVNIGTDISGNYTELAEIYAKKGLYVEIQRLINCADNIRSLTKKSTISKLQNILDANTSSVIKLPSESDPAGVKDDSPDNILPADILDILETVPYKSSDQT